jgi:ribose/xylose/arabinose/galactoside ABC-type transport system permease subunit
VKILRQKFFNILTNYGISIALVILFIVLSFISPVFLTKFNLVNILKQISTVGILAAGVTLIILLGEIDLSFAALTTFLGVCVAKLQGSPMAEAFAPGGLVIGVIPAMIVTVLLGFGLGVGVGALITYVRVNSFVVTLGAMGIYAGAALIYAKSRSITVLQPAYKAIGQGYIGGIPNIVIIFAVVVIVLSFVLHKTRFGRRIYGIGGNVVAAYRVGVPVNRVRILVFGIMGLVAAIAAIALTSRMNAAYPKTSTDYLLDGISAVVIGGTTLSGGRGSVGRTVIGTLLLGIIYNGLTILGVPHAFQLVVKGGIVIGAVIIDSIKQRGKATYAFTSG